MATEKSNFKMYFTTLPSYVYGQVGIIHNNISLNENISKLSKYIMLRIPKANV